MFLFGGLALKNTFTRRYQKDEFVLLWDEMSKILSNTFTTFSMPLYFSKKESFGDMDIILSMEGFNQNMETYIMDTFSPNEIFHNGNAWSFDYKEIQVDFITCSAEDYISNYHYLAYNDLGNFIGRIAQKLGLKYGQEGLWYNHYFKDQKIGQVMISKDYPKIFDFLGFDYNQWLKGFETLEDVFEYVVHSKYFDADIFKLEHLNKINRERNAKRKSYMSFLEYIADNYSDKTFDYDDKTISVDKAIKWFPEARMTEQIRRLEYIECKKLYIKSKFNGDEIMRRYGIKGRELGNSIVKFKEIIMNKHGDFDDYVLNTNKDDIIEEFDDYYNTIIK